MQGLNCIQLYTYKHIYNIDVRVSYANRMFTRHMCGYIRSMSIINRNDI